MREMLLRHRARYPKSDVQDMIKLLYQSELGGGHMIADPQAALARLRAEYEAPPQRKDLPLLEEIDRRAQQAGIVQKVLLEVNIGGEESKSGFAPEELKAAAAQARNYKNVKVLGLRAIPPAAVEEHGNRAYFEAVSRLYVDINQNLYDNDFVYLSMGMSDDFGDAIAAGANMVRIGSAIFGARHYN